MRLVTNLPASFDHARWRAVTAEYSFDLSKTLQDQSQAGLLESTGGRDAVVHLPGDAIPSTDDIFGACTPNFGAELPVFGPAPRIWPNSETWTAA